MALQEPCPLPLPNHYCLHPSCLELFTLSTFIVTFFFFALLYSVTFFLIVLLLKNIYLFIYLCLWHVEVLGPGMHPGHSSDNAGTLTH